jgi:hypothetical protein
MVMSNWTSALNVEEIAEERSKTLELYRLSVEQLRGKTHRLLTENGQLSTAKQFYSFTASQNDQNSLTSTIRQRYLYLRFDVDLPKPEDATKELVVKSATLRLYRKRVRRKRLGGAGLRLRMNVYQVLPQIDSDSVDGKQLVDSRVIDVGVDETWEEFNVLKAVRDWTLALTPNLGLAVGVEIEGNGSSRGTGRTLRPSNIVVVSRPAGADNSSTSADRLHSPTLNVLTRQRAARRRSHSGEGRRSQRRRQRSRRSANDEKTDCVRGDGETRCCRYPLWVSFVEIGWDRWILAPDGYRAYYCDGSCPPRHRVANHFSGIKALVNGVRPDSAPSPCCTATRMSPLTIAHYNRDGRPVVSVFDDMIVDECMCA